MYNFVIYRNYIFRYKCQQVYSSRMLFILPFKTYVYMPTNKYKKTISIIMNGKRTDILPQIAIGLCILLMLLMGYGLCKQHKEYTNAQNDIIIVNDSLRIYKNKLDEEYISKNTYILKAE